MKKILFYLSVSLLWVTALPAQTFPPAVTCGENMTTVGGGWFSGALASYWTACMNVTASGSVSVTTLGTQIHGEDMLTVDGSYTGAGIDEFRNGNEKTPNPNAASANKQIAGTVRPSFANLTSSVGTADINLYISNTNGILITNSLYTQFQYIFTDRANPVNGSVFFTEPASYALAGLNNDLNFVDGYVSKIGQATDFTFPVGANGDYRYLQMSGVGGLNAASIVSTAWIPGNPSAPFDPIDGGIVAPVAHNILFYGAGIMSVSAIGQWDWVAPDVIGGTITVSLPDGLTDFALTNNLRLVGWDPTARSGTGEWIDLSGSSAIAAATGNTKNNTLSGLIKSGITAIGIGSTELALPVIWGSITAQLLNNALQVNWTVLTETNNDRFEIEASKDGKNFYKIGEVKTKADSGNSTTPTNYSFSKNAKEVYGLLGISLFVLAIGFTRRKKIGLLLIAYSLLLIAFSAACNKKETPMETNKEGKLFIRIKQIDTDGNARYSKVIQAVKN
jgi:hypothetical protein